ncbi:MAG TPA: cyclodeaminase/cyclohydrolase family protein [Thermoanaerobaculia bacterium]
MAPSLLDHTAADLLALFAAGKNTPGAGSAAALTGALAGSLLEAVARYTIRAAAKGEAYASFQERAEVLLSEVSERSRRLSLAADEDVEAFQRFWREKTSENLEAAVEVPVGIAEECAALAEIGIELREHGFKAARGEAATAVMLAVASGEAALLVADLNLKFAGTAAWVGPLEERMRSLRARLGELAVRARQV